MTGKQIKYIVLTCVIAFVIWLAGQAVLMFGFPESTLTAARVWVIFVVVGTCVWNIRHYFRAERKKKEEEENDNYKGVY